jgi:superfamily II DNA or RNA helicase
VEEKKKFENQDLTFITNQNDSTLLERFKVLIEDNTDKFECLVGYFYTSGFYKLYKSLENVKEIRILMGRKTNPKTYAIIKSADEESKLFSSHKSTKEEVQNEIIQEIEESDDNSSVEEGITKFIEWLKNAKIDDKERKPKLKIRVYPSQNLHAKVYIMTFKEGDRDRGRVITGSSNFTESGLKDNLEFNVELKNRSDYEFAREKFEELWNESVDISEEYIETVENNTWLNQNITPYQLYLKFLYEYFKDELNQTGEMFIKYLPQDFKKLDYQEQAVLNAKKILEEYGGVFISDVVGLGKTYISAMLAGQLDGRILVIAPPSLLNKNNPGSWPNVFSDFRIPADFESLSFTSLQNLANNSDIEKYKYIIVDEAHKFRTETTSSYELLAKICRGKKVILVTATPYNNSPKDILSLIKLFQPARKSTIPNLANLEVFFNRLDKRLKKLDRQENYSEYLDTVKDNAKEIREKVLKYLMVRRTRSEIATYFKESLEREGVKFPDAEKPEPLYYELNDEEDDIFTETVELTTKQFRYARYMPMLYYKGNVSQPEALAQKNMGKFMKILLVKRLESSFFAFNRSIDRFITSYEKFINEFKKGNVYVSKDYINKIFDLLENDDDEAIERLIEEGKAARYKSEEFEETFLADLQNDLEILKRIKFLWQKVKRDPKLLKFLEVLKTNQILKENKLIVFTESKETAEYLTEELNKRHPNIALCFSGSSSEEVRDKVIENFDARARKPKDDHRILVSTEVLSEGVNLHRSNTVINYDIPWNPTRMMQRVGRINRVDTKFDKIYTFNFLPTKQSNDQIKLKEVAETKINAFLTLLGGDAALLTEGEPIGSHELFDRLLSQKTLVGEDDDESELKYLQVIKEIRDKDRDLFEEIKNLPKKARSAKENDQFKNSLLTYFRKGKLQKFFISNVEPKELDFISSARLLESTPDTRKVNIPQTFFALLDKNKDAFSQITEEEEVTKKRGGRDNASQVHSVIMATLKNSKQLTDDQEYYLKSLAGRIEEGSLPKQTAKKVNEALKFLNRDVMNPFKVLQVLQNHIPDKFLKSHISAEPIRQRGNREVILSLYLEGE